MEEYITQFINSIVPDAEVIFEEDEFCVHVEDRIINVGVNPDPEGDRLIQEFIFKKFGVPMDSYLIGILHEIGHIMTYDPEVKANDDAMYYLLQMNYNEMNYEDYSIMYFSLPGEIAATEWAVNYYLTFQEECDEFMDMIC